MILAQREKEFYDADGDDDSDEVGEDADWNEISRSLNAHCTQINRQHIKSRLCASHDDRRNPAGQGIRPVRCDDIREHT